MACVAFALAMLAGCACIGPQRAALSTGAIASFDQDENAAPLQDTAALALLSLNRRRFSLPSERQPDLRMIYATTYDRRRHLGLRRRRLSGVRRVDLR
jgi:hypothetical protein